MTKLDAITHTSATGSARWQSIVWIAATALVYFLVARFSLAFVIKPEGIAAFWPPSGIFLSAILLTRRSIQPQLVAVLFITDLVAELSAGTPSAVSVAYSLALAGDAVLGAWLLRRFLGQRLTFRRVKHVIGFVLLSVLLSNAMMSVVAALAAAFFLRVPFWSSWVWWWSSDGVGSLLVTPLIMSLAYAIDTRFAEFKKNQVVECVVLLLLTVLLNDYAFAHFLDDSWFVLLLNLLVFPFLIWASFRFGVLGAATTSVFLAAVVFRYAIDGSFAHFDVDSTQKAIVLVQAYVAIATIPSLILAALITERRQADKEARESEFRFRTLAQASFEGIALTKQGVFVDVNDQFAKMLGYRRDELLNTPVQNCIAPEHRGLVAQFMASGCQEPYEHLALRKDGTVFPVEIRARYARMGDQEIRVAAIRDITERTRAEEMLRERNTYIDTVLENAPIGFAVNTIDDGKGVFVSAKFEEIYGVPRGAINTVDEYFERVYLDPAFREQIRERIMTDMASGDASRMHWENIPITTLNGEHKVVTAINIPLLNRNLMVSTVQDVTERRRAEEALKTSEAKFRTLFETMAQGVVYQASDGRITDANPAAQRTLGLTLDQMHGRTSTDPLWRTIHEDGTDFPGETHPAMVALRTGRTVRNVVMGVFNPNNAEHRWINVNAIPQFHRGEQAPYQVYATLEDVTERKQAEEALRERNKYIETILENAPIGFAVNRIGDSQSIFVSRRFTEIYGISQARVNTVDEFFERVYLDPVFRDQMRTRIMTDIASGDPSRMRWENIPITTITGEQKVVDASNIPLWDQDLMVSTVQDVTERWRAEEALKESEERLRLALAAANQGLYDLNVPTGEATVNAEYATMLGYDPATFHETNAYWIERLDPDDRERVSETYRAYIKGDLPAYAVEFRQRTPSGGWKWILSLGKIVARDAEGRPLRMLGTHTDITERKRAEQLLQSLNAAALAMQSVMTPDDVLLAAANELKKLGFTCAIFTTDHNRSRLSLKYNSFPTPVVRLAETLLHVEERGFSMPIGPISGIRRAALEKQSTFVESLEDDLRRQFPEPLSRLAGPLVKLLAVPKLIIAPLVIEDEVVGVFFVLSNDLFDSDVPAVTAFAHQLAIAWRKAQLFEQAQQEVSARKKAEEQVRRLNAELEQRVIDRTAQLEAANKELEAFSYSVSHDLRAPLRAIDGYTRILMEEHGASLSAEGHRVCVVIGDNTRRMGQLIDDLLSFSRLGRAEMQASLVEMEPLVHSVFQELTMPEGRQRIDFRVASLPTAVGDRSLIRQAWINLISNAIKFTSKRDHPLIQVDSQLADGETVYSVRDNGAGFDSRYTHKLFGVFQRLHSEREFEGTGVGLAIVQRVIQRHGGRVWAESVVNQGATFYFTLPQKGV